MEVWSFQQLTNSLFEVNDLLCLFLYDFGLLLVDLGLLHDKLLDKTLTMASGNFSRCSAAVGVSEG